MAVYKIFPEKDATIYSYYPSTNTGLDEILEISTFETTYSGNRESSRALIKFSTSEITNIIANKVSGSGYKAYLKLYLANASEIPSEYKIECYPVSGAWDMGTGRLANFPSTNDGTSWSGRTSTVSWSIEGGDFYTSSFSTQSFAYNDEKDIELDVTTTVAAFNAYETNPFAALRIKNEGFILKHSSSIEFSTASSPFELKYFSTDTHTIYPPCLEIRWDDSTFVTGSNTVTHNHKAVVSLKNNKAEFQQDSVNKFRLGVRDQYPPRTFNTNQLYITGSQLLPSASYWAIKDLDTEEWIVDFDTNYTKISADPTSSFFTVHMNGLQPERFYKIVIKSIIDGSTIIFDEDYIFKVIR
jgi:hypothetical protein